MLQFFKNIQKNRYIKISILIILLVFVGVITIWLLSKDTEKTNKADHNRITKVPTIIDSKENQASPTEQVFPSKVPIQEPSEVIIDYDLTNFDFLDEEHGWVVQLNYNNSDGNATTFIHCTEDGGKNWNAYESKDCLIQRLTFWDSQRGLALAVKGNHILSDDSPVTYQILTTTEGGRTWSTQLECEGLYGASCDIAILDEDSASVVIRGSIYQTDDGGKSWTLTESPVKEFIAEHVFFADDKNGWISGVVGSSVCILTTSDGGKSYQQQYIQNYGSDWVETVGISFADKENGWFLVRNFGTFNGELYRTTNGGSDWSLVTKMGGCRPYTQGIEAVTNEILWIPTHAGAGPIDGGLLYSQDAGTTFEKIGTEAEIVNSVQIEFLTPSLGFIIMNGYQEKYIMKTEDGGKTWVKLVY